MERNFGPGSSRIKHIDSIVLDFADNRPAKGAGIRRGGRMTRSRAPIPSAGCIAAHAHVEGHRRAMIMVTAARPSFTRAP